MRSVIIDHLRKKGNNEPSENLEVLYFYFDYKQQTTQTPSGIHPNLLHQLLSQYSEEPPSAMSLYQRAVGEEMHATTQYSSRRSEPKPLLTTQ
jgi:hypothetical protein